MFRPRRCDSFMPVSNYRMEVLSGYAQKLRTYWLQYNLLSTAADCKKRAIFKKWPGNPILSPDVADYNEAGPSTSCFMYDSTSFLMLGRLLVLSNLLIFLGMLRCRNLFLVKKDM